jgi:hypothetical protein
MRTRLWIVLSAMLAASAAPAAQAALTSSFDAGTGTFTVQSDAGDGIAVSCNAGSVNINAAAPPSGALACNLVQRVVANGGPLANVITLAAMTAADFPIFTTGIVDGGAGADTITGSFQADTLRGGNDADVLVGGRNPAATVDLVFGDAGNDTMTWNPGEGDDRNDGGADDDTSVIVGGGVAETFTIVPDTVTVGRVTLTRTTPAPFFVDVSTTEHLRVLGNGGDDTITGAVGLAPLILLELEGGDGNDTITGGDGADVIRGGIGNDVLVGARNPAATVDLVFGDAGNDTMTWNPGEGDDRNDGGADIDTSVVIGGGAAETFTIVPDTVNAGHVTLTRTNPAPFFVDISTTENLRVDGGGGDDNISGALGLNGLIALELIGGEGADTILGGDGADIVRGGNGNDLLTAARNPVATLDQVFGDAGNDTMVWNPGEGNDANDGGADVDTTLVNGAGAAETFNITAVGATVHFERTLPSVFFIDSTTIEQLTLNASDGIDTVNTVPLVGVNQLLDGGAPAGFPNDVLNVAGVADAHVSPVIVPGFAPIAHANFEFAFGGTINGVAFRDDDADGIRDPGEPGLANVNVFADIDGDRRLDAGEAATLSAANGSYAIIVNDNGNVAVRALPPLGSSFVSTGTEPAPVLLTGGANLSDANVGFFAIPVAGETTFTARVNAAGVTPPTSSIATARGRVILDAANQTITVTLRFADLAAAATSASLVAGGGVDAIVLPAFPAATAGSFGPVTLLIDNSQLNAFTSGQMRFVITTTTFPAGEVAGTVLADQHFPAVLDGDQVVPSVLTNAVGIGTVTLAGPQDEIQIFVDYDGLTGENEPGRNTLTSLHIGAARGQNGPVPSFGVLRVSGADNDRFISEPRAVTPTAVAGLRAGRWYLDVSSVEFPQGEIRGQLDDTLFSNSFE